VQQTNFPSVKHFTFKIYLNIIPLNFYTVFKLSAEAFLDSCSLDLADSHRDTETHVTFMVHNLETLCILFYVHSIHKLNITVEWLTLFASYLEGPGYKSWPGDQLS
jgi:hypothetical protein